MGCIKIYRDIDLQKLKCGVLTREECKCMNEILTDEFKNGGKGGERFELIEEFGCGPNRMRTVYDRKLKRYHKISCSAGWDKREHFFILGMQYYITI